MPQPYPTLRWQIHKWPPSLLKWRQSSVTSSSTETKSNISHSFLDFTMIYFILAVPLLIWLVYSVFKEEFSPLRKIPYASGSVPIFGHALVFLREKNHLKVLQDWSEKHGPIYRYNRGFGKKYCGCFILFFIKVFNIILIFLPRSFKAICKLISLYKLIIMLNMTWKLKYIQA